MHVRVCRDCGEEYRPEIARCADCGGELEDRYEEEAPAQAGPSPAPEPAPADAEYRVFFSAAGGGEVTPLAERLGAAGIPFRVRARPEFFDLLVRAEDLERAADALAPLLPAQAIPEGFDPASGYRQCPACGASLRAAARECPDCGLAVAEAPAAFCPRCARPLGPEESECPTCGPGIEGL